ncbi:MAG: hypothetical protein ACI8WB_002025 [Phenylobacterium sp.]|jgi:hypothetical protein
MPLSPQHLTVIMLAVISLIGCQSTPGDNDGPSVSTPKAKDLLRKEWSCKIKRDSDYQIIYDQQDFYATLTVPRAKPSDQQQTSRLRTDFVLPGPIEDIVSVHFSEPGKPASRLMQGYIPKNVCGDFFVRNAALADNTLSVFSDIDSQTREGDMLWQIIYVDKLGKIFTTQKALALSKQ